MSQSTEPGDSDTVLDALSEGLAPASAVDSQDVHMTEDETVENVIAMSPLPSLLPLPPALPSPLPPPQAQWRAPEAASVRAPTSAPTSSHRRSLNRQTSASFARLTRQAAAAVSDSAPVPPPTPKPKGKSRQQPSSSPAPPPLSPPSPTPLPTEGQPAPSTATATSAGTSTPATASPLPASVAASLRSNQLGADVTAKANIPALRRDMLALSQHLDRLTRTHDTDRATIRDALLRLTMAVDDLRTNTTPASSPTVAFRELEQRVHRLAQGLEREEDARAREMGVMDVRMGSIEDDTRDISRSVTTVSRELAGAISALSQIRESLSTINQQVGDLSNNTLALSAATPAARETALTPATPHTSQRRDRDVSPSPAPTNGSQRRAPRPPQPPPYDSQGSDGRQPKRARGNGPRGHQPPLPAPIPAPIPALLPAPLAGPASFTVRFGAVGWSADPARLRAEVLSTGHLAWNAIPNVFEAVLDIRRDAMDTRFVLLRFPTRFLASSFVEAWVQHGHREQSLRTVHAVLL